MKLISGTTHFEVIEMDDASSGTNLPCKASSPDVCTELASCSQLMEATGALSDPVLLVKDSPRHKMLLSLKRHKKD